MDRLSKNRLRVLLALLVSLQLVMLQSLAGAPTRQHKLLILNSYHPGFTWTDEQMWGFTETVREADPDALLFVEWLDVKRLRSDDEYLQHLSHVILAKYATETLDLIYTTDDTALDFTLDHLRATWPGVPLVATGCNVERHKTTDASNTRVINETQSAAETIEVALRLHHDLQRIVVIQDASASGLHIGQEVAQRARATSSLPVTLLEPMPYTALLAKIRQFPEDTLFILGIFNRDSDGTYYENAKVARDIGRAAAGPVYILNEMYLHGDHVLGGKINMGAEQGKQAGRIAVEVLHGTPLHDVPSPLVADTQWVFNYPALSRFGIPHSRLPRHSTVVNAPESSVSKHPLLIAGTLIGVAAQTVLIVYLLISIHKRREVTLALRQREEQLRSLIEHSPMAIAITDSNHQIVYINQKHYQTFQYSLQELSQGDYFQLSIFPGAALHDEVRSDFVEELERARAEGRDPRPFEWTIKRKDGETVDVEFYYTEIGGQGFGVFNNVTERKRTLAKLEEATRAAQAANDAKSQFLANVSHEIRTPMNGVLGMAQLLMDTDPSPGQREYIDTIRDSSQLLLTIINDLLDLSRIEAGQMPLDVKPTDTRIFVDGVVSLIKPALEQKGLEFGFAVEASVPQAVRCDPNRVSQVLLNLLNNAMKFTDAGCVRLYVSATEKGRYHSELLFRVSDTGIGIAPEQLDRIFLPFNQGDTSATRKHGGTGLGLTICRRLVEMMGGKISVVSTQGKGSEFRFTLPVDTVPAVAAVKLEERIDANLSRRYPLRILVAEDNLVNQKVAQMVLKKMGYLADLAVNGAEAIAMLREHSYDVVLMDIQMPEMDGLTASRKIREEFAREHQPHIIALTAHAMSEDVQRCREAGMDAYLAKPLRVPELGEALVKAYEALLSIR